MDDTKNTRRADPHDPGHDSNNKRKQSEGSSSSQRARKRFQEALKTSIIDIPLEELSEDYIIEATRSRLRKHSEEQTALFFLELTPPSSARGAGCRFPYCEERIREDDYRIAVFPGMKNYYGSADFYHIECFEKLVDFSQSEFLRRLQPLTRINWNARGLKTNSISSGNYLLDGGAERLALYWIDSMQRLIAERDGVEREGYDPEFEDLLTKAGSGSFVPPERPENMPVFEYHNLCYSLAPVESDGPEDEDEWNLIEEFAPLAFDSLDDLNETHSLSTMLQAWELHRIVASQESQAAEEAREKLGEKAVRAIRRLSVIPMPDFQSAFLNFGAR
ncbi:hypothetical protein GGS24DRAFT_259681 [Hypoxylon argillaceum]|nr:hypothetical protein GGS24DRAFT_259681 [Hypoxylon argillaceum]KAI1146520.1 hypothetical protein F4825DRAFT_190654 [Nemania diffusa]